MACSKAHAYRVGARLFSAWQVGHGPIVGLGFASPEPTWLAWLYVPPTQTNSHTCREAAIAPASRKLDRIELAKQAEVVRDDPDRGHDARGDGENVDRAHLDLVLYRRDGSQR